MAIGENKVIGQLTQIRENGYWLWLDDFGSGYSAINVFSHFEFDLIKYDMELLKHLDDNGGMNRVILRELVCIAKELGIHTLIEGLETEKHLEFVKEIGCELAQGFYYNKPESLEQILTDIRNGRPIKNCETPEERAKLSKKSYMKNKKKDFWRNMMKKVIMIIAFVVLLVFALSACKNTANSSAEIDYGSSKIYTREDMDEAIEIIKTNFSSGFWKNCKLHNIRYVGDSCNSKENIQYVNELKPDKNYTQCIQFYTDFRSPLFDSEALNTNEEYTDWSWTFARTENGKWEYLTSGYG